MSIYASVAAVVVTGPSSLLPLADAGSSVDTAISVVLMCAEASKVFPVTLVVVVDATATGSLGVEGVTGATVFGDRTLGLTVGEGRLPNEFRVVSRNTPKNRYLFRGSLAGTMMVGAAFPLDISSNFLIRLLIAPPPPALRMGLSKGAIVSPAVCDSAGGCTSNRVNIALYCWSKVGFGDCGMDFGVAAFGLLFEFFFFFLLF